MEKELTKELAKKLMEIKGEVKGVVFKTDAEYILKEKGEEGLRKVEEEIKKLGYVIDYQKVKAMDFYPVGLRAISLLAIKKVFNFDDEKIKEMGLFATKTSLMVKILMKFFLSIQRVFLVEAPRLWKKHWTQGELIPVELNEEKKYSIIKVRGFSLHPIHCKYLEGYFSGILKMLVKSSEITCQETKCTFKGDKEHEFLIKWK